MSNPYYIGSMAYNPNFIGQPLQNNLTQPYTNPIQSTPNYTLSGYDFVGRYVKSYDEVKNAPFEEKTCIYLDTEHDRIYIKEITKEGVPNINVLGLMDIQNIPTTSIEQIVQSTEQSVTLAEVEELNARALKEITDKFEKRIKTLEDKVQKNF